MKILVIEICNFEDYPTGGQLSFVRNMMKAYGDQLCLAGCSTDDTPVGEWTKKTVDGVQYDYFSVMKTEKDSRKPLVPNRIKGYFALRRHIGRLLGHEFDWIFIQAPEVLFALPDRVLGKVAIDLPGLHNPLSGSRYKFAQRFDKIYDKAFLNRLAKVKHVWATGSSSDIRHLVQRSNGRLDEEEIIQLPTRYDGGVFYPMDKSACRQSTGIPDTAALFVSVGRLNRLKGWPLMLESLSLLLGKEPDARLAIIGDGEDEEEIRSFSDVHGLKEALILTGKLSAPEIAKWLNAADVFVMGSEKEGWSTTLVEACACGTPCVVTDFSSAEDMICDGVNGYIVKQRSPGIFADKMNAALFLDRTAVRDYDKRFENLAISRLKEEMDAVFNVSVDEKSKKGGHKCRSVLLSTMLLSMLSYNIAGGKNIDIKSQAQFDRIQQLIEESAAKGEKDINVNIDKGEYFFSDRHIKIYHQDWKDVNISIKGNECSLVAGGHDYKDGDRLQGRFTPELTFLGKNRHFIDIFGDTRSSRSLVKIVDKESGLCYLRGTDIINLAPEKCKDIYIRLTQWYWARTYKVTKIVDGNIYFVADDLQKVSAAGYNVNYDFIYGMKNPRYRLCNLPGAGAVTISSGSVSLKGTREIHVCEASSFLEVAHSSVGSISISGLSFKGNGGGAEKNLIWSYNTSCSRFSVESCSFENISSVVFGAEYTDCIEVTGSTFSDCLKHVISFSSTCNGCTVSGNTFSDCGKSLGPWHCITVCGDRYKIDHNDLCNFGYGGIFVGCTVDMVKGKEPGGVVEHNRLWQDDSFISNCELYTMMDSGAIYVSTCNDEAVVRDNIIHDISGMKDNRGIFLDDGARNVKVYGNLITGIRNSYSIDSRRITQSETEKKKNNVNNRISDNLTDSPVRFEGNEKSSNCEIGSLSLIPGKDGKYPQVHTKNVKLTAENKKFKSIRHTKWKGAL